MQRLNAGERSGWSGGHESASQIVRPARRGELGGLFFGRRVAQEVATANLRAREVLEQIRAAQRRMELDVEVESCRILP